MKLGDTEQQLTAIARLVMYFEDDERKHYERMLRDGEDVSDNIYDSVLDVFDWLDNQPGKLWTSCQRKNGNKWKRNIQKNLRFGEPGRNECRLVKDYGQSLQ